MKHAYLIIANRNQEQLQILLDLLDDNRNDIYLMIDKKSKLKSSALSTNFSKIYIVKPVNIYWGSYTQVEAEMELFERAHNSNEQYSYYHLISGLDLPLYNQSYIHSFFDNHPGKEFFTFSDMSSQKKLKLRTGRYLFDKHFRSTNIFFKIMLKLQIKLYGLLLSRKTKHYYFGSNWCSVDDEFVSFLLDKKNEVYNEYSRGFLVDELYKSNLLMNNKYFRNKLYYDVPVHNHPYEFQGNLRYINWWDGTPKIWKLEDYGEIKKARSMGHLFSRKFDEHVDKAIIYKIKEMVSNKR